MANTRRETTASNRSHAGITDRGGREPLSLLDTGPAIYSAAPDSSQGINNLGALIGNRLFASIGPAVDIALELHLGPSHGSTVSLMRGNLVGMPLYAVSIFPGRSVKLNSPPTWQHLFAFAILNADFLLRAEFALGTWFDVFRGRHYIDIVICVPDRRAAFALGRHFNQLAIYDLKRQKELAIPRHSRTQPKNLIGGGYEHAPHFSAPQKPNFDLGHLSLGGSYDAPKM